MRKIAAIGRRWRRTGHAFAAVCCTSQTRFASEVGAPPRRVLRLGMVDRDGRTALVDRVWDAHRLRVMD
jgi:hypothetical protein